MKFVVELTHVCHVTSWRTVEAGSLAVLMDQIPEMATGDRSCDHEVTSDLETISIKIERVMP